MQSGQEKTIFSDLLPDVETESVSSIVQDFRFEAEKVLKFLGEREFALTYSGGIDSTILAELVSRYVGKTSLLTLGLHKSHDVKAVLSESASESSKFRLILGKIETPAVEEAARKVSRIVNVSNLSHFEDCVAFWLIAAKARDIEKLHYLVSANGPDELFCGYDRFRKIVDSYGYAAAEAEIQRALESADRLSSEVKKVVSNFGFEMKEPFLEQGFRKYCLSIPVRYKILLGNDLLRKRIWRCFGRSLGLTDSTVFRRKKAMQYGMGIHPVVLSLVKKKVISFEGGEI